MKKNPASSEVPTPGAETRPVRERTLAHMDNILRNATKVGAGIALAFGVVTQGCGMRHIVDPPPPPPEGVCENPDVSLLRSSIEPRARWMKSGRKWTIVVNLGSMWGVTEPNFEGIKREEIQVSGASIKTETLESLKIDVVLTPIRGTKQAELDFMVRCREKRIPLRLKLDLSKPRKKNAWIPVELVK